MKAFLSAMPLIATLALATPAAAQESNASIDRAVNLRGELNFGYDELRTAYILNRSQERDIGTSGFTFGAEVGADARLGSNLLVGAYAGLLNSQLEQCRGNVFTAPPVASDEFCFDAGNNLRAGVRAGLLTGDGGMIYIKGGISRAKIDATYRSRPGSTATVTTPIVNRIDQSETANGYHGGAGAELDLGRSTYVKAEYNYERYKNLYEGKLPTGDNIDASRHMILFGFGVRLGR